MTWIGSQLAAVPWSDTAVELHIGEIVVGAFVVGRIFQRFKTLEKTVEQIAKHVLPWDGNERRSHGR